jgi:translation initiation factor IF-3
MRGDRVKATIVFRGREIAHLDFGKKILERFGNDLAEVSNIELSCKMEGRNMISMFVADKIKIKEVTRKMEQERKRMESLARTGAQPVVAENKIIPPPTETL